MSLAGRDMFLLLGLHALAIGLRLRCPSTRAVFTAHGASAAAAGRRIVVRPEANIHRDEQRLRVVGRVELLGTGRDRATSLRTVVAVDVRHSASLVAQLLLQGKELDLRESSLSGSQGWASH